MTFPYGITRSLILKPRIANSIELTPISNIKHHFLTAKTTEILKKKSTFKSEHYSKQLQNDNDD